MSALPFEELQSAADAFVSQFLGHTNWQLWYKLKEEQGFCSNHEFTSWMLAITEEHIVKNFTREMPADDLPPVVMDATKETRYFSNASSPQFPQSTSYNVDVSSYNCKLEVADCDGGGLRKKQTDTDYTKTCDVNDECFEQDLGDYMEESSGSNPDNGVICAESHHSEKTSAEISTANHQPASQDNCSLAVVNRPKKLEVANSSDQYHCKWCGRSFSDRGNVSRHIKTTHLQKKEHPCANCGKVFSRSDNLKSHVNKCALRRRYSHSVMSV